MDTNANFNGPLLQGDYADSATIYDLTTNTWMERARFESNGNFNSVSTAPRCLSVTGCVLTPMALCSRTLREPAESRSTK